MLHLQAFTFNPFQENTYIIYDEAGRCWIVDPGMYQQAEHQELNRFLTDRQLKPQAIINTHAHIDHILGIPALMDVWKIPFGLHVADLPLLSNAVDYAAMFGFKLGQVPEPAFFIEAGKPLPLGDEVLDVRFVPGHSPGSICFYYPAGGWAIGGDVLFAGSIGRTDLPGGDLTTLLHSIRTQLFSLPDDTVVFPGHGPATRIGTEKADNPFFKNI